MASQPRTPQATEPPSPSFTVAAILPLFNGEAWVERTLGGILAQTLAPDEILVIDDGSTDGGPQLVRELAKAHPQIRLISQANAGQSAARNVAITMCTSEWIALIDQDDFWYPNHLEQLVGAARRHAGLRLGLVYSDFDDVDGGGGMVSRDPLARAWVDNPKRDLMKVLAQGFLIQPSTTLIKREAVREVGGFDERLMAYEDDDLFLRMFRAGYDNVFVPSTTSQWRIHELSAGGSERADDSLRLYQAKLLEAYPNDRWRGHYYRSDAIAPRFIRVWLTLYTRAGRYHDHKRMRAYAKEARALVKHLRPRARMLMGPVLFLVGRPFLFRLPARTPRSLRGRPGFGLLGRGFTGL